MIIKDIKTGEVYYGEEGEEFLVTAEFWQALVQGKVSYMWSETVKGKDGSLIDVVYALPLRIDDPTFERMFSLLAKTARGEAVMTGKLPVTHPL